MLRAPIKAEVTRLSRSTQAIAIWASVCPRFFAIDASPRTFFRFSSDKKSFRNESPSSARPAAGLPLMYLLVNNPCASAEKPMQPSARAIGPQIHRRIERIADAQRLGGFDERPFEFVGDLPHQNEAFCSQANLTCVVEPCADSSRNSLRKIGVFADDECVGPSQFHHGLLDDLPCFGSDC